MQQDFSHPVAVVPSMRVPTGLPLDAGRLACTTCHEPASADGRWNRPARGDDFLRTQSSGTSLCAQCHTPGAGRSSVHAIDAARAHLTPATYSTSAIASSLDAESVSCMACHDGAGASDAAARGPSDRHRSFAGEHPIGVPMLAGRGDRELGEIRSPASLDPRVRLFDGRIGCGSCHSVYAPRPNRLVMSNEHSALCVACHMP